MAQRFEHKSTEERPYDDTEGVDPYAPQMDGWELCGVTYKAVAPHYYPGLRIFYWKRPIKLLKLEKGPCGKCHPVPPALPGKDILIVGPICQTHNKVCPLPWDPTEGHILSQFKPNF